MSKDKGLFEGDFEGHIDDQEQLRHMKRTNEMMRETAQMARKNEKITMIVSCLWLVLGVIVLVNLFVKGF